MKRALPLRNKRVPGWSQHRTKLIWITSLIVGTTVILAATSLVLFLLVRRHRRRRSRRGDCHFRQACLRDPGLTWDEYERKGRLTRSRLLLEEEIQRSHMIRKSQQSRTSDRKEGYYAWGGGIGGGSSSYFSAVSSEQQQQQQEDMALALSASSLPRSPSRSKSWHGRSKSTAAAVASPFGGGRLGSSSSSSSSALNEDLGQVAGGEGQWGKGNGTQASMLAKQELQVVADWNAVHASVERTWQLLHGGRKFPPALVSRAATAPATGGQWWQVDNNSNNNHNHNNSNNNNNNNNKHQEAGEEEEEEEKEEEPPRPPAVRLQTPPLLSHPIFRDGNAQHRAKHLSLPTELTRSKTVPRRVGSTARGLGRKDEDIQP